MTSRLDINLNLWFMELWKVHSVQICPKMCTDILKPAGTRLIVELLCDIQALLETHQVPLLVPHGIIKQLIHWAIPALPKGRSLVATFLVLLLCPQHLHTDEWRHLVSLPF